MFLYSMNDSTHVFGDTSWVRTRGSSVFRQQKLSVIKWAALCLSIIVSNWKTAYANAINTS